MRILTADQGNTQLKFALFDEGREVAIARVPTNSPEEVLPVIDNWKAGGGIFCSVGSFNTRFVETLRQLVEDRLLVMTSHTPLPIDIEYASASTVGLDRVAAAAGAARLFPNEGSIVVDCGSAITIDLLRKGHTFAGGRISPGLSMRIRSLHHFTARLPLIDRNGEVPVIGHSTDTSLRSGIINSIAWELVGAYVDYSREEDINRFILTGGDSQLLLPHIERVREVSDIDFDVTVAPDLVNYGLVNIFEYNFKTSGY